jgi:hypothetical protein
MKQPRSILKIRRIVRRSERGDAGATGSTLYMPFLFMMLAFAILTALFGLWRELVVLGNEKGAYTASVTRDGTAGSQLSSNTYIGLANGTGSMNQISNESNRCVEVGIGGDQQVGIVWFGTYGGQVGAASTKRLERFYAGPADTTGSCRE